MQPDRARFLFDFLLPRLKSEKATTMKILSAVPPDKGDYKPHSKVHEFPEAVPAHRGHGDVVLDAIIDHVFREDDSPMPSELQSGADIARWYDENFAQRLPRLKALSGERLATPVNYIGLLNDPAVALKVPTSPFRPWPNRPVSRFLRTRCNAQARATGSQ